ncbi:MAG: galactokinase [Phycisphaerae bacterium]|nr:galactokinase [Phycisphaerae bacterium]
MDVDQSVSQFVAAFGRPPAGAVRAPGRVNLIGEHTDYNDGFVLPVAIERQAVALHASRSDARVMFRSRQADEPAEVALDDEIVPGEPAWANYPKGVVAGLREAGAPLVGCDVLFDSDVPVGAGLSSSAALEVAAAEALLAAAGARREIADDELVRICQRAEHAFAAAPCGIMDQSIAVMARAGHALLLDCRSGETRYVPFDLHAAGLALLVADTQVAHAIAGGAYAERRSQCAAAASILGVASLRDVTDRQLADAAADGVLDGVALMRARHVVGEIARTLHAVEAVTLRDWALVGELMYASHESLRDDYEVSCPELDAIVEIAEGCEGVHGARMTGGGFGGCAIILADAARADAVGERIASGFAERLGRRCPIFMTGAAGGAGPVTV